MLDTYASPKVETDSRIAPEPRELVLTKKRANAFPSHNVQQFPTIRARRAHPDCCRDPADGRWQAVRSGRTMGARPAQPNARLWPERQVSDDVRLVPMPQVIGTMGLGTYGYVITPGLNVVAEEAPRVEIPHSC